jgi:hypothetical protein
LKPGSTPPFGVDCGRRGAAPPIDLGVAADGNDPVADDGDRGGGRLRRVAGPDVRVR